jgi:hypothetical protein
MEPLHERQIEALRKASGISTFKFFFGHERFHLGPGPKGGRKDEMEKLAQLFHDGARKR